MTLDGISKNSLNSSIDVVFGVSTTFFSANLPSVTASGKTDTAWFEFAE